MKRRVLFDWPGLWYQPRDEMVYLWSPYIYYNTDGSDLAPGINIDRNYGPYESTTVRANYALESQKLFWYLSGWRQSVHFFPRSTFYFWGFDRPGVKEFGSEIEKKWNRVYGRTPTHIFSAGFYVQPEYDAKRAEPLGYDPSGKLAVGYLNWDTGIGPVSLELNGATTIGPFSKWSFNRLTSTSTIKWKKVLGLESKKRPDLDRNITLHFKQRFIAGKIWADELGVPGQEGYNIEGNSSNEMLRKNYLVDQFYGLDSLYAHYHLPGEGNLRGFVGRGERGAEALVASSSEISIHKNLASPYRSDINVEFSTFFDGGIFWDREKNSRQRLNDHFSDRVLADAGFGLRINTSLFEKDVFFRIDIPCFIYDGNESKINFDNWVFSFQRSL